MTSSKWLQKMGKMAIFCNLTLKQGRSRQVDRTALPKNKSPMTDFLRRLNCLGQIELHCVLAFCVGLHRFIRQWDCQSKSLLIRDLTVKMASEIDGEIPNQGFWKVDVT